MTLYLNDLGIACALGSNRSTVAERMFATHDRQHSPLGASDEYSPNHSYMLGSLDFELPQLPAKLGMYNCRNNRLLLHCLTQIQPTLEGLIAQLGRHRIGVVLGTSTSGIEEAEHATQAYVSHGALPAAFHFMQQQLSGGSDFIAAHLGLQGPTSTVSTACSSSANALASAAHLFALDLVDAVVVGGADTLCKFTVQGFAALEAMSAGLSNPFSKHRDGINIGEGAALFVMSRQPAEITLAAVGASSDAHHISAPHPQGRGAEEAMRAALAQAQLSPAQVDYINLHGTGTPQNDVTESAAVNRVFGADKLCSSSKPLTGHTLGAAGILETALCWLSMQPRWNPQQQVIPHLWDGQVDADIDPLNLAAAGQADKPTAVPQVSLSNSFAFGGNNTAVILARQASVT